MKNLFVTVIICICFNAIHAQHSLNLYPKQNNTPDITTMLLNQMELKKPKKETRGIEKRLIRMAVYTNGYLYVGGRDVRGIFYRNTLATYSGTRGAKFEYDVFNNKNITIKNYSSIPIPDIYLAQHDSSETKYYLDTITLNNPNYLASEISNTNTFDSNNNVTETKIYNWQDTLNGYYDTLEKSIFIYNTAGLPISDTRFKWNGFTQTWDSVLMKLNTYNFNDAITFNQNRSYNNGIASQITNNYYTYDTSKQIVSSKQETKNNSNSFAWTNFDTITYIGNAAINYNYTWNTTNSIWEPKEKTQIIYQNNLVNSVDYTHWNDSINSWDTVYYRHDTMQYNANDKMIHYWRYQNFGQGLIKFSESIYERNSNDYLVKSTRIENDTNIVYLNYDADNYLIQITDSINTIDTNFVSPFDFHFYYETYNNSIPTTIKEITNPIQSATLFPNPAITNSYISFYTKKAITTNITVTDMLGKTVYTFAEPATIGDHLIKLPVAYLPNGLYQVNILSSNNVLKSLKLSVQH